MGRGSDLGTLEPGKRADLLVLDADPQSDISHARHIYRVVRGGAILNSDQITTMGNHLTARRSGTTESL
jgi:imidazolonepropionase-like amidohydrolase